jgi:anti-sigma-K factor RsiG
MSQEHVRTARVLDPGYLADLDQRALEDLRAMHAECLELETEVSYVRRVTQARIDILRAEVQRRERGESMEDLIRALPQILADPGPRGTPASSHLPLQLAPNEDSEWSSELAEFDGVLANLPSLSDEELADSIARLQAVEREVSTERRALHAVLDRIDLRLGELLA